MVGLAEELEIDLIVVGTRGRGIIGRALMGNVSDSSSAMPAARSLWRVRRKLMTRKR